jgi:hypothetical protein
VAERRMFAKAIVNSARFLTMPPSSRLLYYDLGMGADDDGIVEAFTVLRMTGAAEDDLKLLITKGFITLLNDELVCHIADWSLNNQIRKDRYKPSIYQDLLSAAVNGNQRLTDGQPNGNQRSTQSSLGKVSSVEVSSVEDSGGLQGRPPDADTREVAFAPSDADEIDFETKRQIALKRMRESYGQGL